MGCCCPPAVEAEAPFFDELVEMDAETPGFSFTATFTRGRPERAADFGRRVDEEMIPGFWTARRQLRTAPTSAARTASSMRPPTASSLLA